VIEPTDHDAQPLLPAGSDADAALAATVRMVSSPEVGDTFRISATLVVDGTTFSGELTSGKNWAAAVAESLRSATGDAQVAGVAMAAAFDEFEQMYNEAEPDTAVGFVHLLNAAAVDESGRRLEQGLPLRFRMGAVSGWTLGTFGRVR
jgi:hypothetical protein